MTRKHHDPEKAAKLDALYALIPVMRCKGLCQDSCGPIVQLGSMTEQELLRLRDTAGERRGRQRRRPMDCPYLSTEGRCEAYEVRPLVCRLWGVVDDPLMSCPHGCEVERMLTDPEAKRFLALAAMDGGFLQESVLYGRGAGRRDDAFDRIRVELRPDQV